jgi:hypothetical protein
MEALTNDGGGQNRSLIADLKEGINFCYFEMKFIGNKGQGIHG